MISSQDRHGLRMKLLSQAQKHKKKAEECFEACRYVESEKESTMALGLLAAMDIVKDYSRTPANQNEEPDA